MSTFRVLPFVSVLVLATFVLALDQERKSLVETPVLREARDAGIGERIPDLEVKTIEGRSGALSSFMGEQGLVIATHSVDCPLSKKLLPSLARIKAEFEKKGIAFLLLNPMEHETKEGMCAALEGVGLEVPYVHDPEGGVRGALGITTTTEVLVIDRARTLVYRGAVSDQVGLGYTLDAPRREFLRDALLALLDRQPAPLEATTAPGCALEKTGPMVEPRGEVTYHDRISRILQRNCQECHRAGEAAPFDLLTYEDARGHRAMMRRVVESGAMPPWFATEDSGPWLNDRSLSDRDRSDLLAWIDAGCPEGDAADAPVERSWTPGWKLGEPDLELKTPLSFPIPAEGTVPYQYATVSGKIKEDCWVQAMEIRPSAPENVHHVLVFVEYPENHPRAAEQPDYKGGERGFFAGMVPGQSLTVYPPSVAKFLPGGARLRFQIHYTTNGIKTKDKTSLGLWLADGKPLHEVQTLGITNNRIAIPPHAGNHADSARLRLPEDGFILGYMPHMHLRGKAFRFDMTLPGQEPATVLDVPHYDFNWQLIYQLLEPLPVPAGTTITAHGWFDNSAGNPANPDPSQTVRFGEQTWEEMLIGYMDWYPAGE
jgi:peroxiredoxin